MSMLSSMTANLRKTADEIKRIAKYAADWRNSVALGDAARELRDAADVIDGLRTTCHDLQAENKKLRELVRDMRACRDHECGSCKHGDVMDCRTLLDARVRELGIEVR